MFPPLAAEYWKLLLHFSEYWVLAVYCEYWTLIAPSFRCWIMYGFCSILQILNTRHLIFHPSDTVIVPTFRYWIPGRYCFIIQILNSETYIAPSFQYWILDIYSSILQIQILSFYCSLLQMLNNGHPLFHFSDTEYWKFIFP